MSGFVVSPIGRQPPAWPGPATPPRLAANFGLALPASRPAGPARPHYSFWFPTPTSLKPGRAGQGRPRPGRHPSRSASTPSPLAAGLKGTLRRKMPFSPGRQCIANGHAVDAMGRVYGRGQVLMVGERRPDPTRTDSSGWVETPAVPAYEPDPLLPRRPRHPNPSLPATAGDAKLASLAHPFAAPSSGAAVILLPGAPLPACYFRFTASGSSRSVIMPILLHFRPGARDCPAGLPRILTKQRESMGRRHDLRRFVGTAEI